MAGIRIVTIARGYSREPREEHDIRIVPLDVRLGDWDPTR